MFVKSAATQDILPMQGLNKINDDVLLADYGLDGHSQRKPANFARNIIVHKCVSTGTISVLFSLL